MNYLAALSVNFTRVDTAHLIRLLSHKSRATKFIPFCIARSMVSLCAANEIICVASKFKKGREISRP
ncbi:hypothetical protein [uncultured Campylobacter sp.]|uniref:hypothetical protein n=1 Tax=uncultured Campylobacter sp. TaxID=218934 RepID=UPI0026313C02|nr:hypothetical protein [uncultured Campylobacter sp.]